MPHPQPPPVLRHIGGFTATNGYAFQAPTGWIGVDAPAEFADWLNEQGIRLAALLLTHAHFDHVLDAAAVAREHHCPVYAWEKSTPETRLETFLRTAAGMELHLDDYPVDHALQSQTCRTLEICGLKLAFAHVPGHSPDSIIFHIPEHDRVFSGDTLMQGTMGRTDFPGGGTPLLVAGIRREILTLAASTTVLSGHGEPTTVAAEQHWLERLPKVISQASELKPEV